MTANLSAAVSAIQRGDIATGYNLLSAVIRAEPRNEMAWWWMAYIQDNPEYKRQCLQQVLAINPGNQQARAMLASLDAGASPGPGQPGYQAGRPGTAAPVYPAAQQPYYQASSAAGYRMPTSGLLGVILLVAGTIFAPIINIPILRDLLSSGDTGLGRLGSWGLGLGGLSFWDLWQFERLSRTVAARAGQNLDFEGLGNQLDLSGLGAQYSRGLTPELICYILLGLAGFSFLCLLIRLHRLLLLTGLAALGVLGYVFANLYLGETGQLMMTILSPAWGWAVLGLGGVLLLVGGASRARSQ